MARTVLRYYGGLTSTVIEFDAVELEQPRHEVEITDYPIELGADLTDHVRAKAPTLRIKGIVTNSPARTGLTQMDGAIPANDYAIRVRKGPLDFLPPSFGAPDSVAGVSLDRTVTTIAQVRTWSDAGAQVQRVQNIYQLLIESMNAARAFTVATDLLGDFDDMLIKSIDTERTSKSGSGVSLTIEMKRIAFAELTRRNVSHLLPKKPVSKASVPKKDEGKKDAPAADKQSESFLYEGWGASEEAIKWVQGVVGL